MSSSSNNVKHYADDIPREVKSVIKALDDDTRLAIIIALMKKTNMSFAELKKFLRINASSLSHHLLLLQNGGLINNFLELRGNRRSYYMTTEMTKSILESLFDTIVKPRIERIEERRINEYWNLMDALKINQYGQRNFESPSSFNPVQAPKIYSGT